jgi:hypothetical protein
MWFEGDEHTQSFDRNAKNSTIVAQDYGHYG